MNRIASISIVILSATLAGAVVAQDLRSEGTRLVAPDEKAWFKRQSPAIRKRVVADLRSAKACISDYARRDGVKDAMTAAGLPQPRLYTGVSNGVVVYRTVPGIEGCSPPFANQSQDQLFKNLPEAYSGPPRTMELQRLCGVAASDYAAVFNRTLVMMKPEAFHAACSTGQPIER